MNFYPLFATPKFKLHNLTGGELRLHKLIIRTHQHGPADVPSLLPNKVALAPLSKDFADVAAKYPDMTTKEQIAALFSHSTLVMNGPFAQEAEVGANGQKLDSEYGRDNWNHSKTHYTIRKFMDESLLRSWSDKGKQPWIYCRLAEIYLNYAEAMFWDGKEDIARTYVNYVRERARGGNPDIVPDVTESGDALWKRIQNERKIELAFEEHRFFDVRRWKIAEDTQVGQFHGVRITKMADGSKKYEVVNVGNKRNFVAPNHYLLPIPNYERRKNTAIEQNPGYSDL